VSKFFITDDGKEVAAKTVNGRLVIDAAGFQEATAWELKDIGMCNGPVCIPLRGIEVGSGDGLDALRLAEVLRRRVVLDVAAESGALGADPQVRTAGLSDRVAPEVVLPDLDGKLHSLSDLRGSKALLVTFATWCGCRYDLPGWQALVDELAEFDLKVYAVAVDEEAEKVRRFTDGYRAPVMIDRHHAVSETYAMSNVPTVVWIDEEGNVALPNSLAFGTDTFSDFTGVQSGPHLDAVKAWVRDGVLPEVASETVADLSDDEIDARLHFRLAAALRRHGNDEVAGKHFAIASELAPFDWTVRRAAMPLTGRDPFGQEFLDLYDEWQGNGAPYHGVKPL
jgi:peroxiredoxin